MSEALQLCSFGAVQLCLFDFVRSAYKSELLMLSTASATIIKLRVGSPETQPIRYTSGNRRVQKLRRNRELYPPSTSASSILQGCQVIVTPVPLKQRSTAYGFTRK